MLFIAIPIHTPPGDIPDPVYTQLQFTRLPHPPANELKAVIVAVFDGVHLAQTGEIHNFFARLNIQIIESSMLINTTNNLYSLRLTYTTVGITSMPGVPFPPHVMANLPQPHLRQPPPPHHMNPQQDQD